MVVKCELCPANAQSSEELLMHFSSHFTADRCGNCHKRLILVDGQYYVLHLHHKSNCNPNYPPDECCNFGTLKTEIDDFAPESDTLNTPALGDRQESCDELYRIFNECPGEVECDAINRVEYQPFEMIECGEIKIESENKLDIGSNVAATTTKKATKQNASATKYKNIERKQIQKPINSSDGKRYRCDICPKQFVKHNTLKQHKKLHTQAIGNKTNQDEVDDLPSDQIAVKPTGEIYLRKFKCNICSKYLLTERTLECHMDIHRNTTFSIEESEELPIDKIFVNAVGDKLVRNFQCDICNKFVLRKQTMLRHMRTYHYPKAGKPTKKQSENHVCDICSKVLKSKATLKLHKDRHLGVKRISCICSYCGEGFSNTKALDEHTNSHTGLKPFKCKECDKTFGKKRLLRVHQRVHTGYKPFKCNQEGCERAYAHGSDLNRHLYGAHGIYKKKHECQICPRFFHEKKILTKHMLTHD